MICDLYSLFWVSPLGWSATLMSQREANKTTKKVSKQQNTKKEIPLREQWHHLDTQQHYLDQSAEPLISCL